MSLTKLRVIVPLGEIMDLFELYSVHQTPATNSLRMVVIAMRYIADLSSPIANEMRWDDPELGQKVSLLRVRLDGPFPMMTPRDMQRLMICLKQDQICTIMALLHWCMAHKPFRKHRDDVPMFLERAMYSRDSQEVVVNLFDLRNKRFAHAGLSYGWGPRGLTYEIFPDWQEKCRHLSQMISVASTLCLVQLEREGAPNVRSGLV